MRRKPVHTNDFRPPKGVVASAAFTQALRKYRFPLLCKGVTSPTDTSYRHPHSLPKRLSYPASAHRLKLSNGLWTSATCMDMAVLVGLILLSIVVSVFLPSTGWYHHLLLHTQSLALIALMAKFVYLPISLLSA